MLGTTVLPATSAGAEDPAPAVAAEAGRTIPDEYIVVLKPGRGPNERRSASAEARAKGGEVRYEYTAALNGFAAHLPPQAVDALRRNPNVAYIEPDQLASTTGDQASPPWGLDRIDQGTRPLNGSYHYDSTGAGVKAYIIDTGMRLSHSQYSGRAINGYDAIDGGTADDCNGHGTHVAGTVGGSTYGVAKGVTLVAVRVLNCQGSGSNSQVIAGIDWVTGNHQAGERAVANMSLTGGASSAIDTAVNGSIADGIAYAVAAGNDYGGNACNRSPARVPAAITVSATTSSDARASYANVGTCLDLFAPGSSVQSSWRTSDTATNTMSGTSMATPHVAGAAALHLETTAATPQQVRDQLV
ncbi:MAG TPA: S8 family peptidase, partial [Acidimicrobiales bacterium]|nr:S8 family peptidase [Acidimicrobiales bacterium]